MRNYLQNFIYLLVFIFISSLLISCFQSQPIPEDKFVKIYSEMIFMQDTSSLSQSDIRRKVLSDYKFLDADYEKTIEVYHSNPEKWKIFFEKVTAYIESLKPKPKSNTTPKRVER